MEEETEKIILQIKELRKKELQLVDERNKILKENNLTWSFNKCKEMKCIHTKNQKFHCGNCGINSYCVHYWMIPNYFVGIISDDYEKIEEKPKEKFVMTGLKYFIGGYGVNVNRFNIVLKETPKYYVFTNGDRVRKDTLETDMSSTPFQNFNYKVRQATNEEIREFFKKVVM